MIINTHQELDGLVHDGSDLLRHVEGVARAHSVHDDGAYEQSQTCADGYCGETEAYNNEFIIKFPDIMFSVDFSENFTLQIERGKLQQKSR